MKKLIKKATMVAIAMSMCLAIPMSVSAQDETGNVEASDIVYVESNNMVLDAQTFSADSSSLARWTYIYKIGIGLTIESGVAYIYTECKTYDSSNISISAELQRSSNASSWSTIKTYTNSGTNTTLVSLDKSYSVLTGYYYRVKLTATAGSETTTVYGNTIYSY